MDTHLAFSIFALAVSVAVLVYAVRTSRKTRAFWQAKERERLARGYKTFTFNVSAASAARFNPLDCATDFASRQYLVRLFSQMAEVSLSAEQEIACIQVLEGLPEEAGLRQFIEALRDRSAEDLGLTRTQYEALQPLLEALGQAKFISAASDTSQLRDIYTDADTDKLTRAPHLKIVFPPPSDRT